MNEILKNAKAKSEKTMQVKLQESNELQESGELVYKICQELKKNDKRETELILYHHLAHEITEIQDGLYHSGDIRNVIEFATELSKRLKSYNSSSIETLLSVRLVTKLAKIEFDLNREA